MLETQVNERKISIYKTGVFEVRIIDIKPTENPLFFKVLWWVKHDDNSSEVVEFLQPYAEIQYGNRKLLASDLAENLSFVWGRMVLAIRYSKDVNKSTVKFFFDLKPGQFNNSAVVWHQIDKTGFFSLLGHDNS